MEFVYCPKCAHPLTEREQDGRIRKVCLNCDFIHYKNPLPAAGVVLVKDNKILLVKRKFEPKAGDWSLPAGFVEYDEGPSATAVRETKEETGIDVQIKELLDIYSGCDDPRSHVVLVIYIATFLGGELQPGDDASDAQYFSLNTLPENIAFINHRNAIENYMQRDIIPYN